jgi:hypothetical protein
MNKWTWTLVLVAVVLLFLWTRENYDNYEDALASVGQTTGYTDTSNPDAPHTGVGTASGTPAGSDAVVGTGTPPDTTAGSGAVVGTGTPPPPESIVPPGASTENGTSTGNTTGGSSLTPQPNSAVPWGKNDVFGPAYTGTGDNYNTGLGEGDRKYPKLIGPVPVQSTMVEGAGIMQPSQNITLVTSGVLPSEESTGSGPNSHYFGTSRMPARNGRGGASKTPGDKDLFPNPYQEFTPSIGSSKTEPVPFLSDFSAFQK